MAELDHLVVSAATLDEGAAHVEAVLDVSLSPGGRHPAMGTVNRLLGLGPELYLEVIAIDPEATAPGRPRWFGLDAFSGPPRLTHWVLRTDDLDSLLSVAPAGSGEPLALARGDLRWRMAVPATGRLPFDRIAPALIEWAGSAHPASRLPDRGCRLERLDLGHPQAAELLAAMPALSGLEHVSLTEARAPAIAARIATPSGPRWL